jgi:hypothetical protein
MVMLHGLAAGRTPTRASQDVDVLADLLRRRNGGHSAREPSTRTPRGVCFAADLEPDSRAAQAGSS